MLNIPQLMVNKQMLYANMTAALWNEVNTTIQEKELLTNTSLTVNGNGIVVEFE